MLEKLKNEDFDKVYKLMEDSFPFDEYKNYDKQYELLSDELYTLYVIYGENSEVQAFAALWKFDKFAYVEHIAVSSELRNSGTGTKMIEELKEIANSMICLEVEPPNDELKARRINFYKRNGFFLNDYSYIAPPLSPEKKPVEFKIMSSGRNVDEDEFEYIRNTIFENVYKSIS